MRGGTHTHEDVEDVLDRMPLDTGHPTILLRPGLRKKFESDPKDRLDDYQDE